MICNFTAWTITILLKYCRYCGINGCFCSICYWYECEYQYRKLVSVFTFVILTGLLHTSNKRSCFTAHAHLCSFYVDVRKAIVAVSALLNSHFALRSLSFVFFKSLHFWLFFFFFYRWVSLTAPPECLTVHTPKPPLWSTTPLIECLKRFVSWPPFNFETTSFIQCLEMYLSYISFLKYSRFTACVLGKKLLKSANKPNVSFKLLQEIVCIGFCIINVLTRMWSHSRLLTLLCSPPLFSPCSG